jgi:hypothetical protein
VERALSVRSGWSWDRSPALRWLLLDEYTTGEPDTVVALCADIDGLFVDAPSSPPATSPPVTLLGCRPEPKLSRALDALARGARTHGGASRRRWITASILSVAEDGSATPVIDGYLGAAVTAAVPSALGEGLLDVTFDAGIVDPMPAGAREIWELWRTGGPAEPGGWGCYDPLLRHHWSGAALAHHRRGAADRAAGTAYHLDGRHVTDLAGFYCAIGEAVNGPGGYFGWNGDALPECVTGGWGATRPFRLVWHDSAVALRHWGRDRRPDGDATVEDVLVWLSEDGVDVELR